LTSLFGQGGVQLRVSIAIWPKKGGGKKKKKEGTIENSLARRKTKADRSSGLETGKNWGGRRGAFPLLLQPENKGEGGGTSSWSRILRTDVPRGGEKGGKAPF